MPFIPHVWQTQRAPSTGASCQFKDNPNGMLITRVGADKAVFEKVAAITKRGIVTGDRAVDDAIKQVVCGIIKVGIPEATCKNVDC